MVTRTQDRNFWTRSNPTNANGYYSSFFPASDQTDDNPVSISVGVALGNVSYGGNLGTNINFARLKSSVLNIQLGSGTSYNIATPEPYTSSIQAGLTVGVTVGDKVVKPALSAVAQAERRLLAGAALVGTRPYGELLPESGSDPVRVPSLAGWPDRYEVLQGLHRAHGSEEPRAARDTAALARPTPSSEGSSQF